jgi:isoleucyl-tRNA synthetase
MTIEFTPEANLTRIEEQVRRFWRRHAVPGSVRAARRNGSPFVIYQQPLDLAGCTWNDQIHLLATTELYARYHTMRGDAVQVQTGWNGHGLAVERIVEQSLDPSWVDLATFVDACRSWVSREQDRLEDQLQGMGLWWSAAPAFNTATPASISAVWGVIQQLWKAGRLARKQSIVPVCPQCATTLSEVEATRHMTTVETISASIRLPWEGEPHTYFLLQAPAPWHLVGMVALAAHPDATYVLVEIGVGETEPPMRLLLAEMALARAFTGEYQIVRRLNGKALRGARYLPPFAILPAAPRTHTVILDETLPLDQGTGLLPVTPSFDERSLALAHTHDLPIPTLLDDRGRWAESVLPWQGLFPQETEPLLIENLQARDLVYRQLPHTRIAAFCPYCQSPLLHLARTAWQIETGSGPWIVGRDRGWATPLPVWVCERCGEETCVAGLDELAHRTNLDPGQIDPHRPRVDRLVFPCTQCDGTMRRVPSVVDAALETSTLPWVTPLQLVAGTRTGSDPRTLAVGLGDPHVGWLGDSTEMVALLRNALAWEQAVPLPQSSSEAAWEPRPSQPADALFWAAHTGSTPEDAEQNFLRPLWQLLAPLAHGPGSAQRDTVRTFHDTWLLARLRLAAPDVAAALDAADPGRAAQILTGLKEDLVNWQALRPIDIGPLSVKARELLGRILAPFVPHLAEVLYRHDKAPSAESVHRTDWPKLEADPGDRALLEIMSIIQRLARLAREARTSASIPPDRTLSQAWIGMLGNRAAKLGIEPYQDLLADILAVTRLQFESDAPVQVRWQLALDDDRTRERQFAVQETREILDNLTPTRAADLASKLLSGMSISLQDGQQTITLLPDEVQLSVRPPAGWLAAVDTQYLVLLQVG